MTGKRSVEEKVLVLEITVRDGSLGNKSRKKISWHEYFSKKYLKNS